MWNPAKSKVKISGQERKRVPRLIKFRKVFEIHNECLLGY